MKLIVFSGVPIDGTPVVGELIHACRTSGTHVAVEEYESARFRFLCEGAKRLRSGDALLFIGSQSLPLLLLAQTVVSRDIELLYWSLEAYRPSDDSSLALKLLYLELGIRWKNVRLIVPIEERLPFYTREYKSVHVLWNVPRTGRARRWNRGVNGRPIRLILYGCLNDQHVYLRETIEMVLRRKSALDLLLVGNLADEYAASLKSRNIHWLPRVPHHQLLELVRGEADLAVVGYRPTSFNTHQCAPNKLFESMSLSLPVLGSKTNPPIGRILEETRAGLSVDLENTDVDHILEEVRSSYEEMAASAYEAYSRRYNFENAFHYCGLSEILCDR